MSERKFIAPSDINEPYKMVDVLFRGDFYTRHPIYVERENWIIVSPNEIRHREIAHLDLPVGTIALDHMLIDEYDKEFETYSDDLKEAILSRGDPIEASKRFIGEALNNGEFLG